MEENVCKWSNWQGIYFQLYNIAHEVQFQKKKKIKENNEQKT